MVYALISDIHGNLPALEAVLEDAAKHGASHYAFLGDYCIGLAYPNEVLNRIRSLASPYVVSGNEDEAFRHWRGIPEHEWPDGQYEASAWCYGFLSQDNKDYICDLPQEMQILHDGMPPIKLFHKPERYFADTSVSAISAPLYAKGIDLCEFTSSTFHNHIQQLHMADAPFQRRLSDVAEEVYIFGHTHIQWYYRQKNRLLISPGSCGLALDFDNSAAYALLSWQGGEWVCELRRVAYDVESALAEMAQSRPALELPVWYGVLSKEMFTARAQAIPFVHFAEQYAESIRDHVRPFTRKTWFNAYHEWKKQEQV